MAGRDAVSLDRSLVSYLQRERITLRRLLLLLNSCLLLSLFG